MSHGPRPQPSPAPGRRRLRDLVWLCGVILLAGASALPMWREVVAQASSAPGIEPREVYAKGDPNQTFDHRRLDDLLRSVVTADGFVDYGALARDPSELDAYLASLADAPFERLGRDARLAFLLNAYNAASLRRVVAHWPLTSVEALPAEAGDAAWEIRLFSSRLTLADLEHRWLRARFVEPRVQFALHRARLDGPPLRAEAYRGLCLERQLADQVDRVYADRRWFRFDGVLGHLELGAFHLRYASDFQHAYGTLLDFVRGRSPELDRYLRDGGAPRVEWLPRDPRIDALDARPW